MPAQVPDQASRREVVLTLIAGGLLLLVGHGLGRFVYTPLLPYLVADGFLNPGQGAALATWNYLGYLIGALLAIRWHRPIQIRSLLPWMMALHVVTMLLQTQVEQLSLAAVLRCGNGIANGAVFVHAPALVLEWLVRRNRASASGLMYLGVGSGLLLSSTLVSLTTDSLSGADRWWPPALLSIPLSWWAVRHLRSLALPPAHTAEVGATDGRFRQLFDRRSLPLFAAYAGAGLGYILPMTFLPLLASEQLPAGDWLIDGSWMIVALATLPSIWFWNRLGAVLGDVPALKLNFAVQLVGVAAAVVMPGPAGITLCAVLVGGSFIGTVLLSQRAGRALHPLQGPRLSAVLVALYALAQIAGPWLAEQWLAMGGTLESAFWIGVGALVWSLLFALVIPSARLRSPS